MFPNYSPPFFEQIYLKEMPGDVTGWILQIYQIPNNGRPYRKQFHG